MTNGQVYPAAPSYPQHRPPQTAPYSPAMQYASTDQRAAMERAKMVQPQPTQRQGSGTPLPPTPGSGYGRYDGADDKIGTPLGEIKGERQVGAVDGGGQSLG